MTDRLTLAPGVKYRAIHHASGRIGAALEQIDEWRTAAQALRALDAGPRLTIADADAVQRRVTDLVLAGVSNGTVPEDLVTQAAELSRQAEATRMAARALDDARKELTADLDAAVRNGRDEIFATLQDDFARVVTTAKKLHKAGVPLDAEDAIATDATARWQEWQTVIAEYAELRQAHGRLLRILGSDLAGPPEATYIRGVERAFKHWADWRRDGYAIDPQTGEYNTVRPPWPGSDQLTPSIAASAEFLAWALEVCADLWMPTPSELEAEHARLAALATSTTPRTQPHEYAAPAAF